MDIYIYAYIYIYIYIYIGAGKGSLRPMRAMGVRALGGRILPPVSCSSVCLSVCPPWVASRAGAAGGVARPTRERGGGGGNQHS